MVKKNEKVIMGFSRIPHTNIVKSKSERVPSSCVNVYQYCAASVIQQHLASIIEFIDWNE